MSTEKLKAYVVQEEDELTGGVVFARFHAEARRNGAGMYGDGDWESVMCYRAREFDAYAPGPVPALVMIQHGWWLECGHCNKRISEDDIQDRQLRPVELGETAYCSPWCRLDDVEKRGQHRAHEKLGAVMAAQHLPPFCTVTNGAIFSDMGRRVLGAHFTYPGDTSPAGSGTWRASDPSHVSIPKRDIDLFQQLKSKEAA